MVEYYTNICNEVNCTSCKGFPSQQFGRENPRGSICSSAFPGVTQFLHSSLRPIGLKTESPSICWMSFTSPGPQWVDPQDAADLFMAIGWRWNRMKWEGTIPKRIIPNIYIYIDCLANEFLNRKYHRVVHSILLYTSSEVIFLVRECFNC